MFETAGIHTFFNGPESFTPDDRYYLGEAPELAATGSRRATTPSASCRRAARAWRWRNGSDDGEAPFDLWEVDIRRASAVPAQPPLPAERVTETLGLLYADHFPYRQVETARGVRRSPGARAPEGAGAVFGEVAGWERANWFADPGQDREYRYDWHRQNWFENQRAEHMACVRAWACST
jgi:hypothetical protein